MRNYKEQTQEILKKYSEYKVRQKKKQRIIFLSLASAACIGIIALSGSILNNQSDNNDKISNGDVVIENNDTNHQKDLVTRVVFNQIDTEAGFADSDNRLVLPNGGYEKKLTQAESFDYLGKDVRPTFLPEGIKYLGDEFPEFSQTIFYNLDNSVYHDQFYFSYAYDFESYNPLEKKIGITVSKVSSAQDDCISIWAENMEASKIKDIDVMIGKREMPYGPFTPVEDGPSIPSGYYDLFVAEFSYDGLNYQVISDNLTEEEFVKVLASMIN